MFTKLFHKELFVPEGAKKACKMLQVTGFKKYQFSRHFEEHLQNQVVEDRSHTYLKDVVVKCLNSLPDNPQEVFEIELGKDFHFFKASGWFVTKYCCRIPYSDTQDLVVAIRPVYENGRVVNNLIVTAWMNHKTDHHYTLDKSKYCSKEEWDRVCL
jgi:hypothetical protein